MAQPLNDAALDQLFRTARTYNGYLDKAVTTEQLDAIWELMKYGPTSANCLPARLIWCVSQEAKEKLAALTMPSNGEKILSAPVSVIIGMDMEFYEQLPELFPHAHNLSFATSRSPAGCSLLDRWRNCLPPIDVRFNLRGRHLVTRTPQRNVGQRTTPANADCGS